MDTGRPERSRHGRIVYGKGWNLYPYHYVDISDVVYYLPPLKRRILGRGSVAESIVREVTMILSPIPRFDTLNCLQRGS